MQGKFSGAVGGVKGPTYIRTDRRNIQDRAAALLEQNGRGDLRV